jgi:hypothetical protein
LVFNSGGALEFDLNDALASASYRITISGHDSAMLPHRVDHERLGAPSGRAIFFL